MRFTVWNEKMKNTLVLKRRRASFRLAVERAFITNGSTEKLKVRGHLSVIDQIDSTVLCSEDSVGDDIYKAGVESI